MFYRNLALMSFGLVLVVAVGCGDVSDVDADVDAIRLGAHGDHSGRYTFALGGRLDDGTACMFSPAKGDVILPEAHSGRAASTASETAYAPVDVMDSTGNPGTLISDSLRCSWSRSGDHGDCVLAESAVQSGAPCSSETTFTYTRVEVVAW